MSKKVLIVGGVAGGASAAARLRRLDEEAHIVMFERGAYISFANCGLPYYAGGAITDRSKLLVQTPEAMRQRFNLDVRTESEVTRIDPVTRTVHVRSREHGEYTELYDALILSPGAKPIRPDLPGIGHSEIYTVRNIPDIDRIKAKVQERSTRNAVVIGGGFIGVEMAENLKEAGLEVTLVEGGPQLLAPFDPEMAGIVAKELEQQGVRLVLSQTADSFADKAGQVELRLGGGELLTADMVILAIGVVPDTEFLRDSGLELGPRGHIRVNERMETNLENVYAVGDAVEVTDFVSGTKTAVPLAGPANKQGRIAADNVCGLGTVYKGTQGTSIIKVFGLTGAATGSSEKTLKRLNLPYHVSYVHPGSHAGYYPGAVPMTIKLLFAPDGTLLGAQAAGYQGVDKRIDDIAAVIRFRGSVTDLTELELAYAPPYSSAKDPVNMAGYAAENITAGRVQVYVPSALASRDAGLTLLVDVRSALEHGSGHIPGSVNIPVDELRSRLNELDPDREIWVYCQVGLRGYTAARILAQKGYRVRNLTGGYKTYQHFTYQPGASLPGGAGSAGSLSAGAVNTAGTDAGEAAAGCTAAAAADSGASHAGSPYANSGHPVGLYQNGSTAGESARLYREEAAPAKAAAAPLDRAQPQIDAELDACGLSCPGPLIRLKQEMDRLEAGGTLRVTASDPGFYEDVRAWANMSGARLYSVNKTAAGLVEAVVGKAAAETGAQAAGQPLSQSREADAASTLPTGKADGGSTMIVFSGDLDKAIASFILATGAAASGKKVTMFFTFWGLNVIRKPVKVPAAKSFMGRMFGAMMPRGSRKLQLSRMNMLGLGSRMIRGVMNSRGISSLEELIDTAGGLGVEMVACQMSMDVMGITREELLDGVKVAGVGYYLGQADQSGINLFI